MLNPVSSKKYSVKDLYAEAVRYMRDEVQKFKGAPLTESENLKLEQVAKAVTHEVVKEMKI